VDKMERFLDRIKRIVSVCKLEHEYFYSIDIINKQIIINTQKQEGFVTMSIIIQKELCNFAAKNLKDCLFMPYDNTLIIPMTQQFFDMDDKAFELWFKLEYGG